MSQSLFFVQADDLVAARYIQNNFISLGPQKAIQRIKKLVKKTHKKRGFIKKKTKKKTLILGLKLSF